MVALAGWWKTPNINSNCRTFLDSMERMGHIFPQPIGGKRFINYYWWKALSRISELQWISTNYMLSRN
jgi:hypothetical protein